MIMKKVEASTDLFALVFYGLLIFLLSNCKRDSSSLVPIIFSPENISTEIVEYASSFSPSGSEVYFSRSEDLWGKGELKSYIYYSNKINQKWSHPKLVSFSGAYDDSAPFITKDGNSLYFISSRPSEGNSSISMDIWKVERNENNEWGTPIRLKSPINSLENEYCARMDKYGNLYFASDRKGGYGQGDLYMAKWNGDSFIPPINLGDVLNSKKGEWNLEINNEGDVLIFEASERTQNLSSYGDLYISFKLNNNWSLPQNIKEVNTTGSDLYPELVEDQNTLYFSSSDSLASTKTNIYSIDYSEIHSKYKQSAVFPN